MKIKFSEKYVYLILLFLPFLITIISCHKKEHKSELSLKITLQFETTWHHQPKKEYFEIYVDPNMRYFTKIKDIINPVDFKEYSTLWSDSVIVNSVIASVGQRGDPVDIVDTSPDKNWVCVRYRELTDQGSIPNIYVLYLIDLKNSKALKRIEVPVCDGYFTKDSNNFLYSNVLKMAEMNLPTQQTATFCDSRSFFMLPGRNDLINFNGQQISLINLNDRAAKNIGKYSNLASECGLINDKWAYLITYKDPKRGGYNLYFINLENYKMVKYPYRFRSASLIRVIPTKNSESEMDKKIDNNSM